MGRDNQSDAAYETRQKKFPHFILSFILIHDNTKHSKSLISRYKKKFYNSKQYKNDKFVTPINDQLSNYSCVGSVLIIQKHKQAHINMLIQRVPISNGVNEPKAEVQWPSLFFFPRCRRRCFLNVSWACIKSEYFIVDFIICLLTISLYLRVHINPTRQ